MHIYLAQCATTLLFSVIAIMSVFVLIDMAAASLRLVCMALVGTAAMVPNAVRATARGALKGGAALGRMLGKKLRRSGERKAEDEDAEEATPPLSPPGSAYEEAMETLGFDRDQSITREELKQRQRLLMSKLHPDTGFPNTTFAQQVNAAVRTIKQAHGWR